MSLKIHSNAAVAQSRPVFHGVPAEIANGKVIAQLSEHGPDAGSDLILGTDNSLYKSEMTIAGEFYYRLDAGEMTVDAPDTLETIATVDEGGPDHGRWVARDTETGSLWEVQQSIFGPQYRPLDAVLLPRG